VIASYRLEKAEEEFCCEDDHCDHYIKIREPYMDIGEPDDNGDVVNYRKCLGCAVDLIEDEVEDLLLLLKRLETM
jgi:hypothetical protein